MCLLRAISHCLTWHGSGHPRVCAMKGFLLDARVLIVEKIVPQKISIEESKMHNVLQMTAA